ncbi:MAG: sulfatase-like hydrolase/transferase [Rikenellaceae bacterium]
MNYHLPRTTLLALPLVALATGCTSSKRDALVETPNIVFIFADDHCFNCLGSSGLDNIKTPNLDRLMESGTHFTHAFNQGGWNGAISAASRAMLITGENMWRAAQHSNYIPELQQPKNWPIDVAQLESADKVPFGTTWPEYMKAAGYDTYITGKWHVDVPADQVFDHAKNIRGGMPNQSADCYNRVFLEGVEDKWQPYDTSYGGFWKGGKHWSEIVKDDALEYIDMAKRSDNPFFMYLAFNAPHDPRQAPKEYVDMYPLEEVSVPENFLPEYPYKDSIGCWKSLRDERLAPFPRTERSVKVNRQEYYALISHLDTQIGIILDALEATGKLDKTYIMFTADHGISIGDHGFIGKQNMYDAAMRVPLFLAGPGIPKGQKVDELVYLQDVMATALDLSGSCGVDSVDFKSLVPLAIGEEDAECREAVYGAYTGQQRSVRDKEYKMIIYPKYDLVRLFNVEEDPSEMVDLASNPEYKTKMLEMFKKFKTLQVEMKDPLNVEPHFNRFLLSIDN